MLIAPLGNLRREVSPQLTSRTRERRPVHLKTIYSTHACTHDTLLKGHSGCCNGVRAHHDTRNMCVCVCVCVVSEALRTAYRTRQVAETSSNDLPKKQGKKTGTKQVDTNLLYFSPLRQGQTQWLRRQRTPGPPLQPSATCQRPRRSCCSCCSCCCCPHMKHALRRRPDFPSPSFDG